MRVTRNAQELYALILKASGFIRASVLAPFITCVTKLAAAGSAFGAKIVPKSWESLIVASPKDEKRIREEVLNDRVVRALSFLTDALEKIVDKTSDQCQVWRRLKFDLVEKSVITEAHWENVLLGCIIL